jgi:hypothetical protein
LFANTDLTRRWDRLGFVVERPSAGPEPIFVETQRGDLTQNKALSLQLRPHEEHGGYPLPKPEPTGEPIRTVESLREHLQAAMAIELSTVPLYLYGMYSVQAPSAFATYNPITGAVRGAFDYPFGCQYAHGRFPRCEGVVAEEMLHLSLAGNILLAVGGKPRLYDPLVVPSYPMLMPGRVPDLLLQLRSMTKENLETFVQASRRSQKWFLKS